MSTGAATVTGMLVLLVLVVLVWVLMLRGWRARTARQESAEGLALPEPAPLPETAATGAPAEPPTAHQAVGEEGVEGVYVSTTLAGQPFERVTAHGLGTRSAVRARTAPGGVLLERPGARSFLVPAADVIGVRRTRGQAGKFTLEKEGLVVITWRLGGVELDTGLRTRRRADAEPLARAVEALVVPA